MTAPSAPSAPSALNRPLTLPNGVVIKNRLLKSAMSETLGNRDCAPTPEHVCLYQAWAEGGIGLCITGNVMIDRTALGEPGNVAIEDARDLEALSAWAQAATANGTQCWVQLNHPGKQSPRGLNPETVAPSAVPFGPAMQTFFATPRALTGPEIRALITRFGKAAGVVKQAGFSGVQIHGAHGYLVSQFLSPLHNCRTDSWGGTPAKRRRFVLEVYRAMRAAVGPEFPIGIKLNSADFQRGGFTEEESLDAIRALANVGIDLIEISGGTYETPAMTGVTQPRAAGKESTRLREAYFLDFAHKARAAVTTPLAVTGGFRSPEGMVQAVESGAADMVGLARIMAMEPDAPTKLLANQPTEHQVKPITSGIGMIDRRGLLEISWYTGQLKRIGNGQTPWPNEPGLWVLAKQAWGMARTGQRKRGPLRAR